MNPRTAGLLVAGGAITLFYLERFTKVKSPGSAERIFIPEDIPQPGAVGPQPPPPAFASPRQSPPGPVQVSPGILYRVTVNVAFPLSLAASTSRATAEAQSRGFTNVNVTRTMPPGWPGARGDYYVTATYSGAPKFIDRSAAGGQVTVTDVWQG